MGRLAPVCSLLGILVLPGCSPDGLGTRDTARVENAESPIMYGAPDTQHEAVVVLFSNQSACSGTIVKVSGGNGYVLTAAHCCVQREGVQNPPPADPPQEVWLTDDYDLDPNPIVFNVIPGSIEADPAYNGWSHDFCMLQFSGANGNTPVIPVMTPAQDNLQVGSMVDFVGYGVAGTQQNTDYNNTTRNHKTGTLTNVDSLTVEYSAQGNLGGPCNGDSGGPALTLGANPVVAAVTSYGDLDCSQYGVSGRVSGAYNSFILPYLDGQPIPPPVATCDSCSSDSCQQGGSCYSKTSACIDDAQCSALLDCFNTCNTNQCYEDCTTDHVAGLPKYVAIESCICDDPTCGPLCANDSLCKSVKCGLGAQDDTCEACIESECCAEAWMCGVDNTCPSCFGNNPPASCDNNDAADTFSQCLQAKCETPCAGLNTGTSSSSSTSSSSGSGNGPGAGGADGQNGAGAGGGVGENGAGGSATKKSGDVGESGSCSASPGRDPLPAAPLAAFLIGGLAALQRRRRSAR